MTTFFRNVALIVVSIIGFSSVSVGQETQSEFRYTLYGELLGNNIFYSFNGEVRFSAEPNNWGFRVGAGLIPESIISTQQINYLIGSKVSRLEIGAGLTGIYGFEDRAGEMELGFSMAVMYRVQTKSGLMLRIGWSPVFLPRNESDFIDLNVFWYWPGVSAGYSF